jgi:hypothetical protein
MDLRWPVLVSAAVMNSACGLLPWPPATCDPERQFCGEVYVTLTGPRDWLAPQDYVLEVGTHGWPIQAGAGGGVVSVEVAPDERVTVRLVQPQGCNAIVEFEALDGSIWVIRFAADGTPNVEDWTGQGVNDGPALTEGRRSDCVFDS